MPLCLPEVNRHMVRFCRILTHERAAAQQAVRGHGAAGSAVDRRRRQSLSFAAPRLLASLRFDRNVLCRHRTEEHTSELQSLMRITYAVFCLKKKKQKKSTP